MPLYTYVTECTNLTAEDRERYEYFVATSMMVMGVNKITSDNLADFVVRTAMTYMNRSEERYSVRNLARIFSKFVGMSTNVTPMTKTKGRAHAYDIAVRDVSAWIADWAAAEECSEPECYSIVWDRDESKCEQHRND